MPRRWVASPARTSSATATAAAADARLSMETAVAGASMAGCF